jgi:hypothetical protein
MDNPAKLVVHKRASIHRDPGLNRRAKVVRREVRAVGQLDVDQVVNRNCGVRCDLDKRVEGESQAVVKFVCQILEQTGIVAFCLGRKHHCFGALTVAREIRLYLHLRRGVRRISRLGSNLIEFLHFVKAVLRGFTPS